MVKRAALNKQSCVASHSQLLYRACKPANNVFFCRDRAILCLVSRPVTVWKARNSCPSIRTAEERNRLAERGHPVCVCTFRRGCDNTMECRAENVITPSSKEIACIHNNSSGLKGTKLSQLLSQIKNGTYYWLGRLKLLCTGVLDLEPANVILKKERDSAIIYAIRDRFFPLRQSE